MTAWRLTWRPHSPPRYQVCPQIKRTIEHAMVGVDPHDPVFAADRCAVWRLWHTLNFRELQPGPWVPVLHTPYTTTKDLGTLNVRALLLYHFDGNDRDGIPCTSSQSPCPKHPDQRYGACCFPTIRMTCDNPFLCVNPFHMERTCSGRVPVSELAAHPLPVLPPCAPCDRCEWTPFDVMVTKRCRGFDDQTCCRAWDLAAIENPKQQWRAWQLASLGRVAPTAAVQRYLRRYANRSHSAIK